MTTSRDRRVAKELADIQADKDNSGVFAAPADGVSLRNLIGMFPAPPDTPYAGGQYEVEVEIPDSYPFKPPKMRFKTKIWHPNVSSQTVRSFFFYFLASLDVGGGEAIGVCRRRLWV